MRAHLRCRIYDCTRFPKAKTIDQFLAVVGESIYEGLAGDLVVLAVRSDPEPVNAFGNWQTQRPVVEPNTNAVELSVPD